jgi:hypothetical protein
MGIFDELTIEYPGFPPDTIYQMYIEIADSYGDFYRVDKSGHLFRLTVGVCMNRNDIGQNAPIFLSDYTDHALKIIGGEETGYIEYLLVFDHGRLIDWREYDELDSDQDDEPEPPAPPPVPPSPVIHYGEPGDTPWG